MARKKGTLVPIDGIKSYRSKGRWYHYDRISGVRLTNAPGTPEFLTELQAARAVMRSLALPPGTLGAVIAQYKATETAWDVLKPDTRISYERAFKALDSIKTAPLGAMTRAAILKFRDEVVFKKHGRWMANYVVTVLGVIFGFALDRGIVKANPLQVKIKKIRKQTGAPFANRPWTAKEREIVFSEAPPHIRLPLAMACCLGLRHRDIFTAPLSALTGGVALLRTSKTGQTIRVPIHRSLAEALATRPHSDAVQVCLNSDGNPWKTGFNASWIKFRKRLEAKKKIGAGLTIHGLRRTLAVMLKEAGLTDDQIADVLGQSTAAMGRLYAEGAQLPDKSQEAVLTLVWPEQKANKAV
jgi:integrase